MTTDALTTSSTGHRPDDFVDGASVVSWNPYAHPETHILAYCQKITIKKQQFITTKVKEIFSIKVYFFLFSKTLELELCLPVNMVYIMSLNYVILKAE